MAETSSHRRNKESKYDFFLKLFGGKSISYLQSLEGYCSLNKKDCPTFE